MQPKAETVSNLLGRLYESSSSPEQWPEFLQSLSNEVKADAACLLLVDSDSKCRFVLNTQFDPAAQQPYADHYFRHDELFARFLEARIRHGEWIGTSRSVMSDKEYHRTRIFNEFNRPLGLWHHCGAVLGNLGPGLEGGIGIQSAPAAPGFNRSTIQLLTVLAPHLRRAVRTQVQLSRIESQGDSLRESVESFSIAAVSVARDGKVIRMSARAQVILESGAGLRLDKGYLRAADSVEDRRLAELVLLAAGTGSGDGAASAVRCIRSAVPECESKPLWTPASGGAMLIGRPAAQRPLQVVVTPFYSENLLAQDRPVALVFLSDPDARTASRVRLLRELYGLTPAESRVADLLARGSELQLIAAEMNIAAETARFHLKQVFRKTQTSRQAELVRMILGLPNV